MLDKIERPCSLAGLTSNDRLSPVCRHDSPKCQCRVPVIINDPGCCLLGCHLDVGMTPQMTMQSTCLNMPWLLLLQET